MIVPPDPHAPFVRKKTPLGATRTYTVHIIDPSDLEKHYMAQVALCGSSVITPGTGGFFDMGLPCQKCTIIRNGITDERWASMQARTSPPEARNEAYKSLFSGLDGGHGIPEGPPPPDGWTVWTERYVAENPFPDPVNWLEETRHTRPWEKK